MRPLLLLLLLLLLLAFLLPIAAGAAAGAAEQVQEEEELVSGMVGDDEGGDSISVADSSVAAWRIEPIEPHGNCLFVAVAVAEAFARSGSVLPFGSPERASLARALRLASNDLLCPGGAPSETALDGQDIPPALLVEPMAGETPREYCRRLRQQGQWGSAAELAALSVVLGREIRVFVKTPGQAAAALPGKLIQRFGAREDRQGGGNDAHWRSDANSNHSISADPALPPSKESPMADLVWSSAVDRAGGVIADGSTALSPSAPLNVLYTGSSHYSALLRHRSPPADRRRVAKPPPVPSSRL